MLNRANWISDRTGHLESTGSHAQGSARGTFRSQVSVRSPIPEGRRLAHIVRITVLGISAFCFALLAPGLARATVHSGRIIFPEPRNPPSIGVPPPPVDQTHEADHEVLARYDSSAGSITFRDEVWAPSFWGEQISDSFQVGPRCLNLTESVLYPPAFQASFRASPKHLIFPVFGETGGVTGEATLRGYAGHVSGTGTFNGRWGRVPVAG
jgi:hypothetical protein